MSDCGFKHSLDRSQTSPQLQRPYVHYNLVSFQNISFHQLTCVSTVKDSQVGHSHCTCHRPLQVSLSARDRRTRSTKLSLATPSDLAGEVYLLLSVSKKKFEIWSPETNTCNSQVPSWELEFEKVDWPGLVSTTARAQRPKRGKGAVCQSTIRPPCSPGNLGLWRDPN